MDSFRNFFLLSHFLDSNTPSYGGGLGFRRTALSSIENRNNSNSEEWCFKNHMGTHIDFPLHFFKNGKSLSDYKPEFFYFSKSLLIDVPVFENKIISPSDLSLIHTDCEVLFIRTGFERFREDEIYWKNGPGVDPSVADFLRERFPSIRTIVFDFISLTSYQNRELGRDAHRAFLESGKEILIVEDAHLSGCSKSSFSSIISPFLVSRADGTPVTILGFD
jgi:arylformamidase